MSQIKVRNYQSEARHEFLWNLIACLPVLAAAMYLLPDSGSIGHRNMLAMFIADGVLTMAFMYLLEKYSITQSGLYESIVITVLSSIYTFVIVCAVNLFFFMQSEKLYADIGVMAAKIILISLSDVILHKSFENEKWYHKPTLLIIGSTDNNFFRMKRIKYGVLEKYDAWYENICDIKGDELKKFAQEKFLHYDAICVLDGVENDEYHIAVNIATEYNKNLFIVPQMVDVGKTNARIVRFDDVLTLYMPQKLLTASDFFLKRTVDIAVALVGFVLACIPMAVISIAIMLTSPGPVFYKQLRLTKDKKEFYIYKFRTMIPDAEKLSGPKFAEKDDPRITPIGKFLRACRLDELPQILNILKGDMSVVGPRPERPVFVQQFEQEIENYDYRFAVKAGLTSLSHVYGRYSTYIHDRTYYDLFYITHYSLFLDFKIILLTTKTLFLKSAAEGEDDFKEKTVAQATGEVKSN